MILALDFETTGLDHYHGAKPFLATTCQDDGTQITFDWDVNPHTRQPIIPEEELEQLLSLINNASEVILHNSKFDVHALQTIAPHHKWDWSKTHDTLIMGHLDKSDQMKNLTDMSLRYFPTTDPDSNIESFEKEIGIATQECRRQVMTKRAQDTWAKGWKITDYGMEDAPSVKPGKDSKKWKFDMWLPKAYAKFHNLPPYHKYWSVLKKYADPDSRCTMKLYLILKEILKDKGLWDI